MREIINFDFILEIINKIKTIQDDFNKENNSEIYLLNFNEDIRDPKLYFNIDGNMLIIGEEWVREGVDILARIDLNWYKMSEDDIKCELTKLLKEKVRQAKESCVAYSKFLMSNMSIPEQVLCLNNDKSILNYNI